MIFSSIPFLYYFLPVVLLVYGLTPREGKNAVLLLFSLVFYGWGEPKYLAVMLVCTALGYGFGLALGPRRKARVRKALLAASVLSSLSFLVYFKYADFFLSNFNALTGRVPAAIADDAAGWHQLLHLPDSQLYGGRVPGRGPGAEKSH